MEGRLDFWSLENQIAGRGRRYRRIVIDEAAFTKNGDNRSDDSMMALWEKGIKPTLIRLWGRGPGLLELELARTRTTSSTISARIFSTGSIEFHATSMDNPLLPKRAAQ